MEGADVDIETLYIVAIFTSQSPRFPQLVGSLDFKFMPGDSWCDWTEGDAIISIN